jgi:ubiquinone/menaquinone biosynthesis C-methylase UbiE
MYDKLSIEGYEELYGDEQRKKFEIIIKNVNLKGKILDVGCGSLISREFFDNVIGIDPCKALIKNKEDVFLGRAEKLPFKDDSFDNVLCVTVLQNVKNINKAISEMERVCKKNFIFSILKRTQSFNKIVSRLKEEFEFNKEIDTEKDLILIKQIK